MNKQEHLAEMVAGIVSAYVSNNAINATDLPSLVRETYSAVARPDRPADTAPSQPPKPAVSVKNSIGADHVTCLEDGKRFQSLRRHLRTAHDLGPEQYRSKWGLPKDYPVVAPAYSEKRSNMARQLGLGQKRRATGQTAE